MKDKLLFYICCKSRVKKSRVIYTLKLGYILLLQDLNLVIIIPIDAIVDNIGSNTIYISLAIGVKNKYKKLYTIFNL